MASCEMCGYIGESLHRAIVEGTLLSLCDKCVRFGEVVQLKQIPKKIVDERLEYYRTHRYSSMSLPPDFSGDENIVKDYAQRVKNAREKTGKTQEEVALDLAEKSSILQKIESGHQEPPMKLARKLEQFFKIQLVQKTEKIDDDDVENYRSSGADVTIGDVIKLKK
ncbi:MAG: multiprotein bridging factor aMBF1 [bacterium]|nr:multiprotein bridging factor aMBF1 [bacterium]